VATDEWRALIAIGMRERRGPGGREEHDRAARAPWALRSRPQETFCAHALLSRERQLREWNHLLGSC
jgi:hypothetical protein